MITLTDANGHATNYTYDSNNRVWTQTNAMTFTTTFTYDPAGNIATRKDANGQTTNYTYDAFNRLTNTAYPDGTSVATIYDALGNKITMTDATGTTTYGYDNLNRLISKASPGPNGTTLTINYNYDSEGNRISTTDQDNRLITNVYDALNRLSTVSDNNGTTTYKYDGVSNKSSVVYPNGVTESYTYDALNRMLTDISQNASGVLTSYTNQYDVAGMIIKKTYQDGTYDTYTYDPVNRLLSQTNYNNNSAVNYSNVYTYDPVGNRMTWTKNTTLGSFWSIDSLNMPAQVLTNMTTASYGQTANATQAVNLTRSYNYDLANRLSNWNYTVNIYTASFPVQTDTYTYDNNGNRLTKQAALTGQAATPQQTSYNYDFENRLNQLKYVNIPNITGSQTDNLIYNGEGLRTQAVLNNVTANYLYDGSNIVLEKDANSNTTAFYTRGLDAGGGIGSILSQSTSAGVNYYHPNSYLELKADGFVEKFG